MEQFSGYRFTLHTALDVEQCRRRLTDDFYDARGNWRHARSDSTLLGWQEGSAFIIYISTQVRELLPDMIGLPAGYDNSSWFTRPPRCTVTLRAGADGTTIAGHHIVPGTDGVLLGVVLGTLFGVIIGVLLIVIGLVIAVQERSFNWVFLIGLGILALACTPFLLKKGDPGLRRGGDRIARYLMRLLDAEAIDTASRVGDAQDQTTEGEVAISGRVGPAPAPLARR